MPNHVNLIWRDSPRKSLSPSQISQFDLRPCQLHLTWNFHSLNWYKWIIRTELTFNCLRKPISRKHSKLFPLNLSRSSFYSLFSLHSQKALFDMGLKIELSKSSSIQCPRVGITQNLIVKRKTTKRRIS